MWLLQPQLLLPCTSLWLPSVAVNGTLRHRWFLSERGHADKRSRDFCSPLPHSHDALPGFVQYRVSAVCWLQTKIHYCLVLCHRGWTDERMIGWAWMSIWGAKRKKEKGREKKRRGGLRETTSYREGGMRKRVGDRVVSQWEQSETSISLTAACMHTSLLLATYIHSITTVWVLPVQVKKRDFSPR